MTWDLRVGAHHPARLNLRPRGKSPLPAPFPSSPAPTCLFRIAEGIRSSPVILGHLSQVLRRESAPSHNQLFSGPPLGPILWEREIPYSRMKRHNQMVIRR